MSAAPARQRRTAAVNTLLSWVAMLIFVIPARTAAARSRSGTPDEPCSTSGTPTARRIAVISPRSRTAARAHPGRRDVGRRLIRIGAGERRVHAILAADLPEFRLHPQSPAVAPRGDVRGD